MSTDIPYLQNLSNERADFIRQHNTAWMKTLGIQETKENDSHPPDAVRHLSMNTGGSENGLIV